MHTQRLDLENFPHSPYAKELDRGVSRLRFAPALEAEYTALHVSRVRLRARLWFSAKLLFALFFTGLAIQRRGIASVATLTLAGAVLPCTLALVSLVWSKHYSRLFLPWANLLVPFFSGLVAVLIAFALAHGQNELLAPLTVDLIAVFLFAGLMFRQAVRTAAGMLLIFAIMGCVVKIPELLLIESLVILSVCGAIAAVVYRDIEQTYRRSFLEKSLISELATRDGLSGLMNRRAFDAHLSSVWQQAAREQRGLAVLLIDIDHFKRFNDDFGHQVGDAALRSVAQVVKGFARRPLDCSARFGGEEFAIILYDLPLQNVKEIAERLLDTVQTLEVKPAGAPRVRGPEITVSVGVGLIYPSGQRTAAGAIQLADEALYAAKHEGRNRVVVKGTEEHRFLRTGIFSSVKKHAQATLLSPAKTPEQVEILRKLGV